MGIPISEAIAGPLADYWLEPAMMHTTGPAATLVGSGPGAGMSMMVLASSIVCTFIGLAGYAFRSVREVETLLPDHEVAVSSEESAAASGAGVPIGPAGWGESPYGPEDALEGDGGDR
jgi:DHA3 family macrolide efflux protein-like MFS transporter